MGQYFSNPSPAKPPAAGGTDCDELAASQHPSHGFRNEASVDDQERPWKFTTHKPIGYGEAELHLRQHENSESWDFPGSGSRVHTDYNQVPSLNPVEDRIALGTVDVGSGRKWPYWGVYDGHSGWATSEILARFLPTYVGRELKTLSELERGDNTSVQKAIESAFVRLDQEILDDGLSALNDQDIDPAEAICRIAPASSGSCATFILLDPTSCFLHVACVGDSRAVLGRPAQDSPEWLTIPLSTDQTGFNQDEIDRINREHPGETPIDQSSGRLLNCAVTRSFGDNRWKWPLEALERWTDNRFGRNSLANYLTPPYLTAQPVVTHTQMRQGDLVILASDGFWNHMESNEDAIHCANLWVKHNSGGEPEMQQREQGVEAGARGTWPYNWTVHRKYFIADGEKNLATHMMKNAFGGSQHGLFRSVMSTKAPDAKEARDDATVMAIRF